MSSEHRLHPYSILFAFLTQIRVFIVPGILVYFGVGSRDDEWWQPWMMIFILPSAAIAVVRYFTYRYRYDENELVIRTGLIFRRERHIPYGRIQNIDAVQNILHRLLAVVEIKIETGGGESAEATMSVLPLNALAHMRERVFAERHVGAAQEDVAPVVDAPPLLQLSVRELLLCGFIENRGAVLIAAGLGLVWELGLFDRVVMPLVGVPAGRGGLRSLGRSVLSNAAISWQRIALTIAAFAAVLLLVRLFSMAWAVIRLYGFRLAIIEGDARSEFGLLTRMAVTVPLRRIQALVVREGPLHRLFRRVAVKVNTAGGPVGDQGRSAEREYVAPILRFDALDDFVHQLVGVNVPTTSWRSPHPGAFRREVKSWLFAALLGSGVLLSFGRWYALPTVAIALFWAIAGARQVVNHLGWALTDDAVLFKRGWLWRRIIVVRFAKIQTVTRHASPFDRRTGMARVHVDTAGASAGSVVNIPYMPAAEADALYEQLSREASRRQFTW
jgi:putative membrane protein